MSTRAITKRVNALGRRLGIQGLSAHDLRHEWTKRGVQADSKLRSLMDAGGWTSAERVLLYAESGRIVNEGVKLASVEVSGEAPGPQRDDKHQKR
jgi:integrase